MKNIQEPSISLTAFIHNYSLPLQSLCRWFFFSRAEDQLSLEDGRVIIPPALQQGFLQPVLEWLETENAAGDENETHILYDQIEPRKTNGNKFQCVGTMWDPKIMMLMKRF